MLPQEFIIFDTESTGLDTTTDEIIEFSYIKIKDGEIIETFDKVLKPVHKEVDDFTLALTGISPKELESGENGYETIEDFVNKNRNTIVIGHNVNFDINMVRRYINDYNPPFIDTQKLAEIIWPTFPSYSLENLSHSFELKKDGSHRAMFDVLTTYKLLEKEIEHIEKMDFGLRNMISLILSIDPGQKIISDIFKDTKSTFDPSKFEININNKLPVNQNITNPEHDPLINYLNSLSGKKLLIANFDIFLQLEKSPNIYSKTFPYHVLSTKKLLKIINEFITDNSKYKELENMAFTLCKILNFGNQTYFGHKNELSLRGKDESNIFYKFLTEDKESLENNPDIFIQRNLEEEKKHNTIMISPHHLLEIAPENINEFDHIIIYPIETAEREITYGTTLKLSINEIKDLFPEICNEIINIIENHKEISSLSTNSKFKELISNIKSNISKDHFYFRNIENFEKYSKTIEYFTYANITKDDDDNKSYFLVSNPIKPNVFFKDNTNIHLLSAYDLNETEKKLLEYFFGKIQITSLLKKNFPKIETLRQVPSYGENFYTEKLVDSLIFEIKKHQGITFLLSPGGSNFSSNFWTKWIHEKNTNYECVAEGIGGINTNLAKIERLKNENLIIVGGENLYKQISPETRESIDRVYYTKLQFPNTFNTFGEYRNSNFKSSFLEYSIPYTSLLLKAFFLMVRKKDGSYPKIFITDSRTFEKDYGKGIIKDFL